MLNYCPTLLILSNILKQIIFLRFFGQHLKESVAQCMYKVHVTEREGCNVALHSCPRFLFPLLFRHTYSRQNIQTRRRYQRRIGRVATNASVPRMTFLPHGDDAIRRRCAATGTVLPRDYESVLPAAAAMSVGSPVKARRIDIRARKSKNGRRVRYSAGDDARRRRKKILDGKVRSAGGVPSARKRGGDE